MVKILEEKHKDQAPEWNKDVICSGCGSSLRIFLEDLEYIKADPQDREGYDHVTFTCPVCHAKKKLSTIPPRITFARIEKAKEHKSYLKNLKEQQDVAEAYYNK